MWANPISPFSAITPAVWKEVRFSSVAAAAPTPPSTSTRGRCVAIRWCCCCPDLSSCSPTARRISGRPTARFRGISFPRRPSGWTLRFSTPCASVRSPIRPSGSSRGLRSGSRWRPTPTATAATCSAIRSSRTVCRICCWRVTTRCSVSQPGSTACRRRPRGSRSCSTVSSLSCTSIAPRSAKCRFTPTNSAFRPVTCRPSCAAWRTVRPRSSSTAR